MDLQELRAELDADPAGLGYAASGWPDGSAQAVADVLNDAAHGATVWRRRIEMGEVYAAVDWSEFIALAAEKREAWRIITSTEWLDASSQNIQDALSTIWPAGTTRTNLIALARLQTGSRAEELWGQGVRVSASQVGRAANA